MSNITYLGSSIKGFESSPQFDGYSKVVIVVSEELVYTAGVDTGRTLTIENPWGTQEMAETILAKLKGFQYQPYSASGAMLDPAAELGDGVVVRGVYSGVYTQKTKFGRMCLAEVSAPTEEEIDHEYPYKPQQERRVTRQLYSLASDLKIQAGLISAEVSERKSDVEQLNSALSLQAEEISAKVSSTGGSASTFGWTLNNNSWTIQSNGVEVLKATKEGLEVRGVIRASSGEIGGFTINDTSLSYNNQTWGGTNTLGIYIGPSGIQLGKNFKVDSSGNLTAASGTFTGAVNAGSIQYGGSYGTLNAGALTNSTIQGHKLAANTVTTSYTSSGINTSLGYADYANGVFGGWEKPTQIYATNLFADNLFVDQKLWMVYKNASRAVSVTTLTINGVSRNFLTIG